MIFNANGNTGSASDVAASPYKLGVEGALMHVYETECNYNAMMKAVGLSELKYFSETGKDLFINEAGAFGGFIEKAKALFKKIIEKIKAIFKTFMAKINSFAMKDKEFVKKYEKDIMRKDVTDLEFTGYEKFKNGDPTASFAPNATAFDTFIAGSEELKDSDATNDKIESLRGSLLGESSMTEAELREKLHEELYGDKETFDVTSAMVRTALSYISDTSKVIKAIEKLQKDEIKSIENVIKNLDKNLTSFNKDFNKDIKSKTDDEVKNANELTTNVNNKITVAKSISNDLTVIFGAAVNAAKDANRQAKALCVKVLSYNKKESAKVSESAAGIFSDVNFA